MGLTPHPPLPDPDPADRAPDGSGRRASDGRSSQERAWLLDDLAAFALDAVDLDEEVSLGALLMTDPVAAPIERDLREAAGALAESMHADTIASREAAGALRDRVLAAAHAARPPTAIDAAGAAEVHGIELERVVMLLRRLRPEQWDLPLDPPEFAGWTIKDLAAHLASNEGLAVQVLGLAEPALPESTNDNEARTAEVLARHRSMTPAETVDELEACFRAVDQHVRALDAGGLDAEVHWWGMDIRILTMLMVRSFETWTHADDIRRAVGLPQLPPPAPSLARMSEVASTWSPVMLAMTGHDGTGRSVELHLTGLGGGVHHVGLGGDELDLRGKVPDAVITMDVVDYCRAVGDRIPPGGVPYEATGDLDTAATVVGALNALAAL